MNVKQLIIATTITTLSALGATAVQAQEATPDNFSQALSLKSRAEVRNELAAADRSFAQRGFIEHFASMKSREQAGAEVQMARANGELAAIDSRVYAFSPMTMAVVALRAGR